MEMPYTSENKNELNNQGYTIIDNILPLEEAYKIYNFFKNEQEWSSMDQIRENHYEHVFKSENPYLPQSGEIYMAKFSKSFPLSLNNSFLEIYKKYINPIIENVSPFPIIENDVRCHKQDKGDNFRVHMDDYAGSINAIYYVNKEWRWDWGGILHVLSNTNLEEITSIFPKFNRLVLLNNKVFRAPHFVSTVEKFAKNPRYSIVSFNK